MESPTYRRGKRTTPVIRSGRLGVGGDEPLLLIAGPCVIESREVVFSTAEALLRSAEDLPFCLVFKSSYDKANRSSPAAFRGPGLAEGLKILAEVKEQFSLPVTSDVHSTEEARIAREVLDIVQVPALLCRQNDLLREAAATGKIVNIKKGQFLAPAEVPNRAAAAKAPDGTQRVIITERGTCFGYHTLVNDFRAVAAIRASGLPVVFDATHSVQKPGWRGDTSGGERRYAPVLARAAAAVGVDGFFFETHPRPDRALCDGPNMLPLTGMRPLLEELAAIDELLRPKAS